MKDKKKLIKLGYTFSVISFLIEILILLINKKITNLSNLFLLIGVAFMVLTSIVQK